MNKANLLNELYLGNIQSYAKQFDKNSESGRLMVAMCKRETELTDALEINPVLNTKRVITPPSMVNGEKKIPNMSLPFAQTAKDIQDINPSYGSSCKGFAMAALLTFYSMKLISPHWLTRSGWIPPECDNAHVTSAVTYENKGAFKLVS